MADIIELIGSDPTNTNIERVQTNVKAVNLELGEITDKGYVNAKVVTNLNDALENGKYKIIISGHSIIAAGTYLVDTTKYDATASSQILRSVNVNGANTTYIRLYRAGIETVRLIATTEKTDILCTANTGYTLIKNNSKQINNILYIDIAINKTDGTNFAASTVNVCNIPAINGLVNGYTAFCAKGETSSGSSSAVTEACRYNNTIFVVLPNSNTRNIYINGVVVL